jgi:uncharacterized spore protein YtfJ
MSASTGWIEGLAQRLGATATAATIFGAPIERGDVTVVPVARAAYGFGGGSGTRSGEEGAGGGGGVRVSPVGFFEIRSGVVHYRPIRNWAVLTPVLVAGGLLTLIAAWNIGKVARR